MDRATLFILVVVATTVSHVSAATGSCPPGQYVVRGSSREDTKENGTCRDCDRGTFSSGGQCDQCAPGSYQPKTGQLACFPCQAGHFANSSGATFCKPCAAGHFAPRQGAAVCSVCPPGHQQPQAGHSACIPGYIYNTMLAIQHNIDDLQEKNKNFGSIPPFLRKLQQTIDRQQGQINFLQSKNRLQDQINKENTQKIDDQEQKIDDQKQKIHDQEQNIYDQQQKINDSLNAEIGHMKKEYAEQQAQLAQLSQKLQQQQTEISNLGDTVSHVENGTLVYYNPYNWSSTDTYTYTKDPTYKPTMRYKDISVTFSEPYSTPPTVSWSIGAFFDYNGQYVHYAIELREVTTTGFTMRASCRDVSRYMFWHLAIEWISIPSLNYG